MFVIKENIYDRVDYFIISALFYNDNYYISYILLANFNKKRLDNLYSMENIFTHPKMVFTSTLGNYRDRSALNTSFKRFLKGSGFEFLTLHQLRHCNATLLLNSGVDLKVVSEHLGHCDIGVTANVYADVLKSTKMKVAELVSLKLA